MKQPILKSNIEIKYKFKRLTEKGQDFRDSCSTLIKNVEYMACTDFGKRSNGLAILKDGAFDKYLIGRDAYAPCWYERADGKVFLFFCLGKRIWFVDYAKPDKLMAVNGLPEGHLIDPEVVQVGNTYYMFFTLVTRQSEGNELYVAQSEDGYNYYNTQNLNVRDFNVEEGLFYNKFENVIYWSVGNSDSGSTIRRGNIKFYNGKVGIDEGRAFVAGDVDGPTCTHPDCNPHNGKLRATLRDNKGNYYIGELI